MAKQNEQRVDDGATLPPSGVVVVDKPQGVTSHDIVAAMRRVLHTKKVGHAGTLDPMATGVLVVGYGQATRLLNAIVGTDKTYEAIIRFGQATDSDDADGAIAEFDWQLQGAEREAAVEALTQEKLQQLVNQQFVGEIQQVPNVYSAIKVHGKRAYELAREGKDVELEARPVTIHECQVLDSGEAQQVAQADYAEQQSDHGDAANSTKESVVVRDVRVRVTCSAGTYIRALARDLGQALGVGAHLVMLRRTRVGMFQVSNGQAESTELADSAGSSQTAKPVLYAQVFTKQWTDREGSEHTRAAVRIDTTDDHTSQAVYTPLEVAQHTIPAVLITEDTAKDARFGRKIDAAQSEDTQALTPGAIVAAHTRTELVALVRVTRHRHLQPVTVFASE